ncbi:MAG: transporter substrate-binding domain-containing protein, partial [Clostridiales bacterium]|nr:transporter substrate-binding domain-containing protein [Clostridiales bacterium]
MKRRFFLTATAFVLLCCIFAAFTPVRVAAQPSDAVVRVGFFAFDGYHMTDERGVRSGYGYEYMLEMAKYTDWVYDYKGYDASWADAQEMLENGEIDILTSAQKTDARLEKFDFSDAPIGISATI